MNEGRRRATLNECRRCDVCVRKIEDVGEENIRPEVNVFSHDDKEDKIDCKRGSNNGTLARLHTEYCKDNLRKSRFKGGIRYA